MPMAGKGLRFVHTNEITPKPLIRLSNKPFFWWAVQSAKRAFDIDKIIFIVRKDHCDTFKIDSVIKDYFPNSEVVILDMETSGSSETVLAGIDGLDEDCQILVNDCDHGFLIDPKQLENMTKCDAFFLLFSSNNKNYSYAKLGTSGQVLDVAEKKVISKHAIAGCYYFKSSNTFKELCNKYLLDYDDSEPYVSGLIKKMIGQNMHVEAVNTSLHCAFGTPQELVDINQSDMALLAKSFSD